MIATNCTPMIEQAEAQVTGEVHTGTILSYDVITQERNASVAWSDDYLENIASGDYADKTSDYTLQEENIAITRATNVYEASQYNSRCVFQTLCF